MAVAGTYSITIETPMGDRKSDLTLVENNNTLTGTLVGKESQTELTNCELHGNNIAFEVTVPTIMGKMNVQMNCTIDADNLTGTAKLPLGEFKVKGTRK